MKVLFDHQIFSYQRYGGASKYFAEVLLNLPENSWFTSTIFSNNEYVKSLKLFDCKAFLPNHFFRGQGRIMNELNKFHSKRIIASQNFDVFHQTHFETYCLKPLKDKPMVTTFHDINFSTINSNPSIVRNQKISLDRADHIICISENTKKDMLSIFDVDPGKVSVIYHGVEHFDLESLIKKRVFDESYILYVGTREKNKNWNNFINAFSLLSKKHSDIKLVCTGKNFTKEEIDNMQQLNVFDSVIHISASEEQMKRLYRDCEFFVFPSLYEGFGMPLLEAMVCNAPIVCANASCFPEIAKEAALYFDPNSVESIYTEMENLLINNELRNKLIMLGKERVANFSWKRCADEHFKVYKKFQ